MAVGTAHAGTLNELLDARVADGGDEPALIQGDTRITYAEVAARVRRVAAGLARLGIGPGDRVAVWLGNDPAWIELEFALARLGAVAVAINTKYRRHEVEDIVGRSGARALVLPPTLGEIDCLALIADCDDEALAALETLVLVGDAPAADRCAGRSLLSYAALDAHGEHARDEGTPDAPCMIFTSSGTTSAPKLVTHRQAALVHHALAAADAFGYRGAADTVVLAMLPYCGVFGFNTVMGAFAAGRPTVLLPAFEAGAAVAAIERHGVTHTNGADEMFRRILDAAEPVSRIATLREGAFANFSADAAALVDRAHALGIKLFQTYGASEVQALMVYAAAGSGPERWAVGGGTPSSPDTRVRVRDTETGRLLGPGESGEIEVGGPHVMVGYLGNDEANAKTFTDDGFVRTGDLGYMESGDTFVYLARLGDTLRLGGFLVNPREIEAYLESFDAIDQAQVVAVDTERGPRPVAWVIVPAGHHLDADSIIAACQADMAKYKVPVRLIETEAFPTTPSANGVKIQKAKLRERAQAEIDAGVSS